MCKPDCKTYLIETHNGARICQSDIWKEIMSAFHAIADGCRLLEKQEDGTYKVIRVAI